MSSDWAEQSRGAGRQCSRERRRCHRRIVAGVTITRDCRHPPQTLAMPDPEEAIHRAKLGPRFRPPVHRELVAQGQVLGGELAMAAAEEREKSKQVKQEGDHRAEILSGSAPTDQRLAADRGFGEGQGEESKTAATLLLR